MMLLKLAAAGALLALAGTGALAQDAAQPRHQQAVKQIGKPSASGQVVPSLIVLNSKGAKMTPESLVLEGVSSNAIIFADRPVRSAGHALTAHLLEEWGTGSDSFGKDPPNATISVFDKDGKTVKDAVVVLKTPRMEGENLTFAIDLLEGDLSGVDGPASVFIDIIGLPRTPLSFAGAARRTAYRGAFYATGAAGAAAAAGAAYAYGPPAYYPPPPPYYRPPYYHPYYRPYY
jgi:hypothetical protein